MKIIEEGKNDEVSFEKEENELCCPHCNCKFSFREGNIDVVSTQPQVEVPNVFASTPEPVVENSIPNFAADETEMNKIVEEVDKNENKEENKIKIVVFCMIVRISFLLLTF